MLGQPKITSLACYFRYEDWNVLRYPEDEQPSVARGKLSCSTPKPSVFYQVLIVVRRQDNLRLWNDLA